MMMQTRKSKCKKIVREYIQQHNPYEQAPKLGYNIAEMSRYAAENNRKISELTAEEVEQFSVR